MKKNIVQKLKNKDGFSLVETLIAVIIIIISVVTPLSIASRAITFANVSRDSIVATNLAQEAIEFIRSERDGTAMTTASPNRFSAFLAKFGYNAGNPALSTACFSTAGCAIDVRNTALAPIASSFTDVNFTNGTSQIVGLSSAGCSAASPCTLSVNSLGLTPNFLYGYAPSSESSWRPTSFERVVKMSCIEGGRDVCTLDKEVKISVEMKWRTGPYDKNITIYEFLKSWPDGFL
jgi:Tfp pilus assembly protein PilV